MAMPCGCMGRGDEERCLVRIVNHDYAGHPFQVQLSRELARRGHAVLHVYSASNQTPHGALCRHESDSAGFQVAALRLAAPFQKWSYWKRRKQELEYAAMAAREIERFRPGIVLSANTPTEIQQIVQRACFKTGGKFIFWVQDVYSIAVDRLLRKKLPIAGALIGKHYIKLDRKLLRRSDGVVLITDDFRPLMERWGVEPRRMQVVENWAPLDEMPLHPKDNAWSREHGLTDKRCLIYSGTLGMKHNPDLLLQLALRFQGDDRVRCVVISEGPGIEWLREKQREHGLTNLRLLDWQPFDVMPQVLASAEILLAVLEPDAGVFSVPSKVLTYLCAQRPVLLAVPAANLAARIVRTQEAGLLVPPEDTQGFVAAAERLMADDALRSRLGENGRRYAETHFEIGDITDRFEGIFRAAMQQKI